MICSPAGAHHRRWSFVILLIAIAVAATEGPWVRAQSLGIPVDAKLANDMTPYRTAIEQKLTPAVADLADPSPDKQVKARLQIENECRIAGKADLPSPAYLDAYTRALNKLLDAVKTNESVRIRMNAALAVCNVAQIADNDNLKDAVQGFVQDKNPAVALWGIKGAKYIIPAQLRNAQIAAFNPTLVNAVINAVKTHTEGAIAGAIAGEAYDALTLDISNNPGALAKMKPKMVTTIAPFVIELLKTRTEMYRKGVPASPRADAWGTRFLTDPTVWPLLTKPQKLEAMQTFCNLIGLAGKQAEAANAGDRADLAYTIARAASAVSTVVPGAAAKLAGAVNLKPTAPATEIKAAADSVLPAVKAEKDYVDLKPAPELTGHEAAPAPASAPTTGPVAIPGAGAAPPPGAAAPAPAAPVTRPTTPPTRTPAPGTGTAPRTPPKPPAGTAHPTTPTKPPDAR